MIGHTQPRRIAARGPRQRASRRNSARAVGDLVGYKVRFTDRTGPRTLIKLMTDGILLRELEGDPLLERYDTLIIDEAHERNLNVDFLLGVCRRLLPRRPDLELIITSATIEPQRFAEYLRRRAGHRRLGRSYPVEVRYRPLAGRATSAPPLPEAVRDALRRTARRRAGSDGDVLVFLPGEKQIRETRDTARAQPRRLGGAAAVRAPVGGRSRSGSSRRTRRRRVVLATNVAETSLTVPGVRYVIDAGLARISRYSARAKVQRLPIEPVAQASADQRRAAAAAGRPASASACMRRRTSWRGRASPSPRSCAPTSPA